MGSAVPKRMVTIYKWRVPAMFLVYMFIVILLVISAILPWVHCSVTLTKLVDILSAEGSICLNVYLWGHYELSGSITAYTKEGVEVSIPFHNASGVISAMYPVFASVIILIVLNLILALSELGKFKFLERITDRIRFIIETACWVIALMTSLYFAYFHNTFGIMDSNIGSTKASLYSNAYQVTVEYTHTDIGYSFSWGPGYVIFFICTVLITLMYIDKYIFTDMLELSSMWRFRGHLNVFALFMLAYPFAEAVVGDSYHMWSSLYHLVVFDYGCIAELNPSVFIKMVVLIYINMILFTLGTTILPSRHVMKSTPFITLALPDEEILRRHKMLPSVTRWKRVIDFSISIIAFIALVLWYLGLVRGLGGVSISISQYGGVVPEAILTESPWIAKWSIPPAVGELWSTPPAYILTITIMIQALIILKPTR